MPDPALPLDPEAAYRACSGREARWDGRFFLAVLSTGVYCRPSCPARTPKPENCRFLPTAAACVAAGFRACRRCRPDALPGLRDRDGAEDLAARALRRIRDGAVDELGVAGLADSLHVSERQLRRAVLAAAGTTPGRLAAHRRAAAARQLIEQTRLPLSEVAFAAGFGSLRRFNEAMRAEFGAAPSALPRPGEPVAQPVRPGTGRPRLALRLRYRPPLDADGLRRFLRNHAVPGLERADEDGAGHERVLRVPGGHALARIRWPREGEPARTESAVAVRLELPELSDLMPAIAAVRRMLDLDADPGPVTGLLAADPLLGPLAAARPGVRIPGAADPAETALMTVLGQQVSVAAARTVQGRAVAAYGGRAEGLDGSWRSAPQAAAILADGVAGVRERLRIDGNRATALVALAGALAAGLRLDAGADRRRARARLLELPRIGPWTAELIALRCLGDPDAFPAGDLVLRRTLGRLAGSVPSRRRAQELAEAWRPWRGYAAVHLWTEPSASTTRSTPAVRRRPPVDRTEGYHA
ncbi:MAG: AlkA N-terminal domain-containing protein [Pseudoclavibacter sp.]|nr:AlkA N-terminal domain-containing protein [Pseudoclavibacter sp.]